MILTVEQAQANFAELISKQEADEEILITHETTSKAFQINEIC